MDQATLKNKNLLGLFRKRSTNTNLFGNHFIPYNFNYERKIKVETDQLRNITDFEFLVNRQNPHTAAV